MRSSSAILFALIVLLGACAPAPVPDAPRTYVYPVPPGSTFDMNRGRALSEADETAQLTGPMAPRIIFLGEQHGDPRSVAAHVRLIGLMVKQGRPVTVALEMFSQRADAVLEAWRQGQLSESEFVAQSGWYENWGFPWRAYRALFLMIREERLPARGVNADDATRTAVRENKLDALPPSIRTEVGDFDDIVAPHRDYLFDSLRAVGHGAGGRLSPDSPAFQRMQRVQVLWDRLMGIRAAKLAEELPGRGAVVVVLGAGHVAFGLGANLQAARVSLLPQLSVWETLVSPRSLQPGGSAAIPLGMADWVRVFVEDPSLPTYPNLSGVKLASDPLGVRVEAVRAHADDPGAVLRTGDIVQTLGGDPVHDPTDLRLRVEGLAWDRAVPMTVLRKGEVIQVSFTPRKLPLEAALGLDSSFPGKPRYRE